MNWQYCKLLTKTLKKKKTTYPGNTVLIQSNEMSVWFASSSQNGKSLKWCLIWNH